MSDPFSEHNYRRSNPSIAERKRLAEKHLKAVADKATQRDQQPKKPTKDKPFVFNGPFWRR